MTSRTSRTPSRRMRTTCRFERLIRTLVVAGALVAADAQEIVIRHENDRVGAIHVHFPRAGYDVVAA